MQCYSTNLLYHFGPSLLMMSPYLVQLAQSESSGTYLHVLSFLWPSELSELDLTCSSVLRSNGAEGWTWYGDKMYCGLEFDRAYAAAESCGICRRFAQLFPPEQPHDWRHPCWKSRYYHVGHTMGIFKASLPTSQILPVDVPPRTVGRDPELNPRGEVHDDDVDGDDDGA